MERIALIPAYEPGDVIFDLVRNLKIEGYNIVIVDDGSGRDYQLTFNLLKKDAVVLQYEINRGKGYALKYGLAYIRENFGHCTVVTMDSDGQHLVEDANKVCAIVEEYDRLFVVGSRVLTKDAPTKSRLGNDITRKVFKAVTGIKVYDTQSGLRAFDSRWIPTLLNIDGDRYEYEMNVLLYIAKEKLPIKEVPISVIYFDKQNSVSHFNAVADSIRIYSKIFKFALSSFLSFLIDFIVYSLLIMLFQGLSGSLFPVGSSLISSGLMGNGIALIVANYGARAVSSVVNFTINKRLVFASEGNTLKEAAKYFGLVIAIITVNTLILSALAATGINLFVAKILVELIMFLFNYIIQHKFVFRKAQVC